MHDEFTRSDVDRRHVLVNLGTADVAAEELVDRWERGDLRISRVQ
jgi:hypothetical protein